MSHRHLRTLIKHGQGASEADVPTSQVAGPESHAGLHRSFDIPGSFRQLRKAKESMGKSEMVKWWERCSTQAPTSRRELPQSSLHKGRDSHPDAIRACLRQKRYQRWPWSKRSGKNVPRTSYGNFWRELQAQLFAPLHQQRITGDGGIVPACTSLCFYPLQNHGGSLIQQHTITIRSHLPI